MTDYPTITRAQLIRAAERTLEIAKRRIARDPDIYGFSITPEQEHCYLEIAKHVDLITPGWVARVEDTYERCGCLVGSLRLKRGLDPTPDEEKDAVDHLVGVCFPGALQSSINREDYGLASVFRVVEDERPN